MRPPPSDPFPLAVLVTYWGYLRRPIRQPLDVAGERAVHGDRRVPQRGPWRAQEHGAYQFQPAVFGSQSRDVRGVFPFPPSPSLREEWKGCSDGLGWQYHTRTGNYTFDTVQGKLITWGLNELAKVFDLSFLFGTAPHDYTLSRCVFPFP